MKDPESAEYQILPIFIMVILVSVWDVTPIFDQISRQFEK